LPLPILYDRYRESFGNTADINNPAFLCRTNVLCQKSDCPKFSTMHVSANIAPPLVSAQSMYITYSYSWSSPLSLPPALFQFYTDYSGFLSIVTLSYKRQPNGFCSASELSVHVGARIKHHCPNSF
jgi:hypothetical protein